MIQSCTYHANIQLVCLWALGSAQLQKNKILLVCIFCMCFNRFWVYNVTVTVILWRWLPVMSDLCWLQITLCYCQCVAVCAAFLTLASLLVDWSQAAHSPMSPSAWAACRCASAAAMPPDEAGPDWWAGFLLMLLQLGRRCIRMWARSSATSEMYLRACKKKTGHLQLLGMSRATWFEMPQGVSRAPDS